MEFRFNVRKNGFPGAPAAMRRAIGTAFASAKGPMLADMQRRTPVDTGGLRASETAESDDQKLTLSAGTDHALYVHQGTRSMGARPFMRESVEAGIPAIEQAIADAADSGLAA